MDERLDQLVRVEWRHLPLDDALAGLAKQTGVSLKADGDASDLRVTGFVFDRPLREVMSRLAVLLQLTWSRNEPGGVRQYTLYSSQRDKEIVNREKRGEWERFRFNIRRMIRAATQPESLGDDPYDRAAKRLMDFLTPQVAFRFLGSFPETLLDRVIEEGTVRVPFAALSPLQQDALRGLKGLVRADARQHALQAGETPSSPAPGAIEQGGLELKIWRHRGDGQRSQLMVGAWGPTPGTQFAVGFALDPSMSLSYEDRMQMPRHFGSRECGLTPPETMRFPEPSGVWEDALAQFARQNRVSVLSESFDTDRPMIYPVEPPPAGAPVPRFLDYLCVSHDQTWNAEGPVLLFRQRDWYLERDRQIPERLARHWRDRTRNGGVYLIADLARMAAMNDRQRDKLWKYAGNQAQSMTHQHREALLLYQALRPEQRALAAAGGGLPVDRLDVAQQKLLPPVVQKLRPGALDVAGSFKRLEVREKPGERYGTLTFVFRDDERRTVQLDRKATPMSDPWSFRFGPKP